MDFIDEQLLAYCESFSEPESALLRELNRTTHLKAPSPRMLSGHLQGRFLSFISRMIQPVHALEIGTYTGYSALCLAEGLATDGKLITIDPNEETNHIAQDFITRSPFAKHIGLLTADAADVIPTLDGPFDLVFIDADKRSYARYFELVIGKVRPGGVIIADNTLWSGKVLSQKKDADTAAIQRFNEMVAADARVRCILLPLRDGLTVMTKVRPHIAN
jgi:caffeoyl-CoA O-methyltransferase